MSTKGSSAASASAAAAASSSAQPVDKSRQPSALAARGIAPSEQARWKIIYPVYLSKVSRHAAEWQDAAVHGRLVAAAFHGKKPAGAVVDHINQNPRCNHAHNLRYLRTAHNFINSTRL